MQWRKMQNAKFPEGGIDVDDATEEDVSGGMMYREKRIARIWTRYISCAYHGTRGPRPRR